MEIPGYTLLREIGEGGTAVVWHAQQQSLNREVAIKVLRQQFAADQEEVNAFLKEAHSVAKLNSRHIVRVIDAGQHNGTFYLVMEFVDGQSLQEILEEGNCLSQKRTLTIVRAVADALREAWDAEKIIHRDIKPANIIVDHRGEVKVADLGIAGIVDSTGQLIDEEDGTIVGTPNYMSPEQASGSTAINYTADMYSLGAVMYHMLTGYMPFEDRSTHDVINAQVEEQLTNPRTLDPKLSLPCAQMVAKLMMKDPGHRYASWDAFINDVDRLLAGRMVIIKTSADATSTIAPAEPVIQRQNVARQQQEPEEAPPPSPQARWLRLALWSIFGLVQLTLILVLLWVPWRQSKTMPIPLVRPAGLPDDWEVLPSPQRQPTTRPPEQPPRAAPTAPVPQPSQPPAEQHVTARRTSDEEEVTRRPTPRDATADVSQPTEAQTSPLQAEAENMLNILRNSIIHVAVAEGFDAAARLIDEYRDEAALNHAQQQLEEMDYFLHPDNRPLALIAKQFTKRIGQDAYINVHQRRVDFRITGVQADVISTLVRAQPGTNQSDSTAELRLEILEADEQLRWLGKGNAPEYAFCMAIIALREGKMGLALEKADACGPFRTALRRYAMRRMPRQESWQRID